MRDAFNEAWARVSEHTFENMKLKDELKKLKLKIIEKNRNKGKFGRSEERGNDYDIRGRKWQVA